MSCRDSGMLATGGGRRCLPPPIESPCGLNETALRHTSSGRRRHPGHPSPGRAEVHRSRFAAECSADFQLQPIISHPPRISLPMSSCRQPLLWPPEDIAAPATTYLPPTNSMSALASGLHGHLPHEAARRPADDGRRARRAADYPIPGVDDAIIGHLTTSHHLPVLPAPLTSCCPFAASSRSCMGMMTWAEVEEIFSFLASIASSAAVEYFVYECTRT